MRFFRGLLKVGLWLASILLAISFVRIVITGDKGATLSFYNFMQYFTSIDYDFGSLLNSIIDMFDKMVSALSAFSRVKATFWSGKLVIDKILSIFSACYELFKGITNFMTATCMGVLGVFYNFGLLLKAIVELFVKLFGAGITA